VQAAERPDAADRNGDRGWHPGHDPPVEQDPPTGNFADVDQLVRVLVLLATPTEPEVTDVTAASAARVSVGDHHRIGGRMLGQPVAGLFVEGDQELHPLHD
jgi:hypothetical protein